MTPSPNPSSEELDEILKEYATWVFKTHIATHRPYLTHAESKRRIQSLIDAARLDTIDKVFELSPKALFKDWKPQDAFAFYERLKAYEQELKPPTAEQPTKLEGE